MATHNVLLLKLIFSLFAIPRIEMVWSLFFLIKLWKSVLLEVQSHFLKVPPLLRVHSLMCYVLFLVWCLCHCPYHCHFPSKHKLRSSLWDGVYFFVLHCLCHLTICKIEACHCCLELLQFVSSCYSGNKESCCLYLTLSSLSTFSFF